MRTIGAWVVAFLVLGAAPIGDAGAEIDGDRFTSERWGVSLRAPSHWRMSERTSYPNIILWMTHTQPAGRMLLSAEEIDAALDAEAYAKQTAEVLEELGFTVRTPQRHAATGAFYFDFDNCGDGADCEGKAFMRQAFLVSGGVGYALTLATEDVYTRGRLLRAWDIALRSMSIRRPTSKSDGEEKEGEEREGEPENEGEEGGS